MGDIGLLPAWGKPDEGWETQLTTVPRLIYALIQPLTSLICRRFIKWRSGHIFKIWTSAQARAGSVVALGSVRSISEGKALRSSRVSSPRAGLLSAGAPAPAQLSGRTGFQSAQRGDRDEQCYERRCHRGPPLLHEVAADRVSRGS